MAQQKETIGFLTSFMAEMTSRLNFFHRRALKFPLYRLLFRLFSSRKVIIGIPYLWLTLFFLLPFLIIFRISFTEAEIASPPFSNLLEWVESGLLQITLNFQNYLDIWQESIYVSAYLNSLKVAAIATSLTLLIGYPIALAIARSPKEWHLFLVMLIILPFWTSFLIRVYAWITILSPTGLLNNFINTLGVFLGLLSPENPIDLGILHTDLAVYIGIVYGYLPFMVLPLYATLNRIDGTLIEAAEDLGCPPFKSFWLITFRLSLPGVLAGSFLVFIPAVGEFIIPDLLGGSKVNMIGKVLYDTYLLGMDLPLVAAISVILLVIVLGPIYLFNRIQSRQF